MILSLPLAFPVTFGPHAADWWMVVITALAAIASVAVAISAFSTSARAQRTANASEKARAKAETDRTEWEYRLRFEDALATFMKDIGVYLDRLAEARSSGAKSPTLDPLHPSIQVVLLRARDEDALTMDAARRLLAVAFRTKPQDERRVLLADLVRKLRGVADGSLKRDAFEKWVAAAEANAPAPGAVDEDEE